MAQLKKLPSACIAPLRLDAVTLHGIGSYLKPARLEIRPLTILCGTNGSGKSTWIKVLTLLQECAREESFPWNMHWHAAQQGWRLWHIDCTLPSEPWSATVDAALAGPPGTISLEFACVRTLNFPAVANATTACFDAPDVPTAFKTGRFMRGDRIAMRITPPLRIDDQIYMFDWTLLVNGQGLPISGYADKRDQLSIRLVRQGADHRLRFSPFSDTVDADGFAGLSALGNRLRQLVSTWGEGFFRIGAIRDILAEKNVFPEDEALSRMRPELESSRWVGAKGEHTHALRAIYAFNPVLDPRANRPYTALPDAPDSPLEQAPLSASLSSAYTAVPDAPDSPQYGSPGDGWWPHLCYPVVWRLVASRHPQTWRDLVAALVDKKSGKLPAYAPLLHFAERLAYADRTGDMTELAAFFRETADGLWRGDEAHIEGMKITPLCQCKWTAKRLWPRSFVDATDDPLSVVTHWLAQDDPNRPFISTLPELVGSQRKKVEENYRPDFPAILTYYQDAGGCFSAGESFGDTRRQQYGAVMEALGAAVSAVMTDPGFLRFKFVYRLFQTIAFPTHCVQPPFGHAP